MSAGYPCGKRENPRCPLRLSWRRVALPEKAASCHWGREHKQEHNTAPLIKKLFFLLTHWKNKKDQFFPFGDL